MNGKILRLNKIDERYILSPKKFLYTFGYMCLGDKLVNSNLNKKELYFFLDQVLTPVPEEMVTIENVAKGDVILIGRGNNFNAYLRPRDITEEIEPRMLNNNAASNNKVKIKVKTARSYYKKSY